MSTDDKRDHLARCEQLLREAESYEHAEDWENAVAKYRALNDLDHLYQGAEAKLLYALTERDAGRLYREGQEHLSAERYAEAREAFRKARMRAGVYKDTAALIKLCDEKLGAAQPAAAPAATKKGCLGSLLLFLP